VLNLVKRRGTSSSGTHRTAVISAAEIGVPFLMDAE